MRELRLFSDFLRQFRMTKYSMTNEMFDHGSVPNDATSYRPLRKPTIAMVFNPNCSQRHLL